MSKQNYERNVTTTDCNYCKSK